MSVTYFNDKRFLDLVVALLVKDRQFLKVCGHVLTNTDFKPTSRAEGRNLYRWVVAQIALAHYEKYHEPVKELLPVEILQYASKTRINGDSLVELSAYCKRLLKKKVTAVDSVVDKVLQFKRERLKEAAVHEMIDLQARGELTDEKWLEISRSAIELFTELPYYVSDYFAESDARIDRRIMKRDRRFPVLMIEPLDAKVRAIARGQIGLIIAPYKRGKSLMLIWIAVAYVLQRLNVLFITLEDPPQDVEDRFDACITFLPIKKLEVMPRTFKERFLLFKRLIRSRLKIVDRTERKTTIRDIEAIIEEERNKGFIADAVIIDYDDEIAASKRNSERRLELAEIYRDMRQLAAKKSLLVWTAAQSRRSTAQKRQLGGDDLAEDISKVLKVAMAISLGQGDWGPESIYLWVAAHKFDRQHVGANIMTNKNRMLIYDREKTLDAERHPKKYMVHEEGGVKYE